MQIHTLTHTHSVICLLHLWWKASKGTFHWTAGAIKWIYLSHVWTDRGVYHCVRLCVLRVMELPYAFQCCAFISCERRSGGAGGLSWEREEARDSAGRDAAILSSQGEPQHTMEVFTWGTKWLHTPTRHNIITTDRWHELYWHRLIMASEHAVFKFYVTSQLTGVKGCC